MFKNNSLDLDFYSSFFFQSWLKNISTILFLNKLDLLTEKIIAGRSKLEDYFPDFTRYQTPSDTTSKQKYQVFSNKFYLIDNPF
jgi:guanine nucleotide-binding protein G(s) subunit alpha